ncbi:MAG: iron-sulfur cluster assembly protein IscA [Gammaproteobacteria bacterium RBG_16_51_14]|nr:MAG: iron-sulfur cluster assembly protein IscA [Gammaproteobacteria bacterium RBG_16_51_14]
MTASTITLTDRAASHIRRFLDKNNNDMGLRVGIKPAGCSGYQYVVEAATSINDHDQSFESNGVKIIIDELSLKYLAGTELDYVRNGLNEGFKFSNPNVQETCGCGESFNVTESIQ